MSPLSSNATAATAFAASVTCEDKGAVYLIGTDGNGTMTVVERLCVCDWAPSGQLRVVKGLACEVP